MEIVYGQFCGTYTLELDQILPFFEMSNTGSNTSPLDPNNTPYTDLLTLSGATNDDVGEYVITMTVKQEDTNGDGYSLPYSGTMAAITY